MRTKGVGIALAAIVNLIVGSAEVSAQDLRLDSAPLTVVATVPSAPRNSGIGGSFELVDHNGQIVTDAVFRGRYMLIYFGYSFCPDICPTALARMTEAIDFLEQDGARITPIFITVDPERDTPEVLKAYVAFFHPRLVGLTGSSEQIDKVAKAYRVFYKRMPVSGELEPYYTIDHSSVTYFVGPDGVVLTHFWDSEPFESMAQRMRSIMGAQDEKTSIPTSTTAEGLVGFRQ